MVFRFTPLLRRYLWGGRRLGTVLGKPIGEGDDYAESWEIVDRGPDQSVVREGPAAGMTLHQLVETHGRELLGRHFPQPSFPLLLKFLDAQRNLSVQVHPDDRAAAQLTPPDLGKTEAWVVLEALPGSLIYAGLKRGFDRLALEREVHRGTTELCLHRFEPQPGDCVFIPAGTVHAIGAGLLIAEIQQASDTTFRLYDWNRVGPDGKPRALHIAQSLDAIDFDAGPIHAQIPQATGRPGVERLVACDKFVLDRWSVSTPQTVGGDDRFHILAMLAGGALVDGIRAGGATAPGDPSHGPLVKGETCLVPACRSIELTPLEPCMFLDMYLP